MADRYVVAAGTWDGSDTSIWSATSGGAPGASVPTTADDVYFDSNSGSGTVTIAAGNTGCKNIDFTSYGGTLAGTAGLSIAGGFTGESGMVWSYTGNITFTYTGGDGEMVIASNGKAFDNNIVFNGVGGEWILADDLVSAAARTLTITNGSFNDNGQNVTFGMVSSNNANTRSVIGSLNSVWTLTGTTNVWLFTIVTNLTFSAPGTIKLTNASASSKNFSAGGLSYNQIWLTGAGTGAFFLSGNATVQTFTVDTPPHTISRAPSTTWTVTTFNCSGADGNYMTIQSSGVGQHTWTKVGGGIVECDFLILSNSIATPGSSIWYAGNNSIDSGGNSGWIIGGRQVNVGGGGIGGVHLPMRKRKRIRYV